MTDRLEDFNIRLNELRQDYERYKEDMSTALINMFNKLLNKIEELEKNGKK